MNSEKNSAENKQRSRKQRTPSMARKSLLLLGLLISTCSMLLFCESKPSKTAENTPEREVADSVSAVGKTILAVFAHPDDEYSVAPILAKYAEEGAKVQVVTATDGRYGTGQTDLKPGDELIALRKDELKCAASSLGIEEPIWLGYHDQLKLRDGFFGHVPYVQDLMRDFDSLVKKIEPDIILTWGPDGGSNHMDHRLVGASITQVFLSQNWEKTKALYYVARPASKVEDVDDKLLRGVADSYLTHVISYSKEDGEKAINAFACYKTQFSQESMDNRAKAIRTGDYKVYFRPLITPKTKSDNLFTMPE